MLPQLIFSLLNDKTNGVVLSSFDAVFDEEPDDFLADILHKISILAPNLRSLCVSYVENEESIPSPFSLVKEPLANLCILSVSNWLWSDNDLDLMTSLTPNLENLMVCD
jgi:hypothetical protein